MLKQFNNLIRLQVKKDQLQEKQISYLEYEASYKDSMVYDLTDLIKKYINRQDDLMKGFNYEKMTKKQQFHLLKRQEQLFYDFSSEIVNDFQPVKDLLDDYYITKLNGEVE